MVARVITVPVDIDKMDAGIREFEEVINTVVKQEKGFAGVNLLLDRSAGKVISIAMYDTEEDATAVEESGVLKDVISKLSEFMVGTPSIEGIFEVTVRI